MQYPPCEALLQHRRVRHDGPHRWEQLACLCLESQPQNALCIPPPSRVPVASVRRSASTHVVVEIEVTPDGCVATHTADLGQSQLQSPHPRVQPRFVLHRRVRRHDLCLPHPPLLTQNAWRRPRPSARPTESLLPRISRNTAGPLALVVVVTVPQQGVQPGQWARVRASGAEPSPGAEPDVDTDAPLDQAYGEEERRNSLVLQEVERGSRAAVGWWLGVVREGVRRGVGRGVGLALEESTKRRLEASRSKFRPAIASSARLLSGFTCVMHWLSVQLGQHVGCAPTLNVCLRFFWWCCGAVCCVVRKQLQAAEGVLSTPKRLDTHIQQCTDRRLQLHVCCGFRVEWMRSVCRGSLRMTRWACYTVGNSTRSLPGLLHSDQSAQGANSSTTWSSTSVS